MDLASYFKMALDRGASDLHLVGGNKPALRVDGGLELVGEEILDPAALETGVFALMQPADVEEYKKSREMDIALDVAGGHFRVNVHQQEGKIAIAARIIPSRIPGPKDIGLTETLYNLSHLNQGLILVTGPSGSGKSTTLAVLLNLINQERRAHIITIEDPIEFIFQEQQSIIEQRELGRDTHSFGEALKRALRQDPNVIMVGEMRDLETMSATLTAAETGHLVISTLHTNNAAETIERIVDAFPAHQQAQIRTQLASVLRAVVCQQLLPKVGGGRVAVREVLINTSAVANSIREGKISAIPNIIQTGRSEGMISMTGALKQLNAEGSIDDTTLQNRLQADETIGVYY
jgi:pilus retraction protein PilT